MAKKKSSKRARRKAALLSLPPAEPVSAASLWGTGVLLGVGVLACLVGLVVLDSAHGAAITINLVGLGIASGSAYLLSRIVGERRRNLVRAELVATKLWRLLNELDQNEPGRQKVLAHRLDDELNLARQWLVLMVQAEAYDQARVLDSAIGDAARQADTAREFEL